MADELNQLHDDDLDLGDFSNENPIIPIKDDDQIELSIFDNTPIIKEPSIVDDFLKSRGLNPEKIKILDDNGSEQEIDFYSLSKEEQLEILSSVEPESDYGLDDTEIDLINHLRTNNLTVDQYINKIKEEALSGINSSSEPVYETDAYDDNEIFLLDLKNKFDLTDEELEKELEKELQNEPLFKKKVEKIRAEYKQLEDEFKQQQETQFQQEREQQYAIFTDTMVDVAIKTEDIFGIELEDNEKNEVLSSLLDLDEKGVSNFYKALNEPENLYKAAWFLKYGKEAFDAINGAYQAQINELKKSDDSRKVIIKKPENNIKSIHDLS